MRINIDVSYDEAIRVIAGLILSEHTEKKPTSLVANLILQMRKKSCVYPKVLCDDIFNKVAEIEENIKEA